MGAAKLLRAFVSTKSGAPGVPFPRPLVGVVVVAIHHLWPNASITMTSPLAVSAVTVVAGAFWTWAAGEKARFVAAHRAAMIVFPLLIKFLNTWPSPEHADGCFRVFLVGPIAMNTVLSTFTTESFAEFVVWRLGPAVLGVVSSYESVAVLQALSRRQIWLLCLAVCAAPVYHQMVATAWRRWYLEAPYVDAATECGSDRARSLKAWMVMSAFLPVAVLVASPDRDEFDRTLRSTVAYLRNTAACEARETCGIDDLVPAYKLPVVRVFMASCFMILIAWRCLSDNKRHKEHASQDPATHWNHAAVETRRQQARMDFITFGVLACSIRALVLGLCSSEMIAILGIPYTPEHAILRHAGGVLVIIIFGARSHRTLVNMLWVSLSTGVVRIFLGDMLVKVPEKTSMMFIVLCIHIANARVRESRVSYAVHSLIIAVVAMWRLDFDAGGVMALSAIVALMGALFFLKLEMFAAADRAANERFANKALEDAQVTVKDVAAAAKDAVDMATRARMDLIDAQANVKMVKLEAKGRETHLESRLATAVKESEMMRKSLLLAAKGIDVVGKGIIITNVQQEILTVNQMWTQITGYARQEVVGRLGGPKFLQGPKTERSMVAAMRYAIRNGKRFSAIVLNYKKNGEEPDEILQSTVVD